MNNKPAHEIRNGGVKATIWSNDKADAIRHTVSLSRSYKAGEEWKQVHSFHKSDLAKLISVLTEAEQWIASHEAARAA